MDHVAGELALTTVLWVGFGIVAAGVYAALWTARPKLRWVAAWPLIVGSMFWAQTPPRWLAPAPRDVQFHAEQRRVIATYRNGRR